MAEGATEVVIEAVNRIADIDAAAWDACANPEGLVYNPFLTHRFLAALEASESAVARTGWAPYHLTARSGGEMLGVMPMYLKNHSQGEYVFDYAWADAFHRAGGSYYPKLQVSVPFTPATGRRVLTRPGPHAQTIERHLVGAAASVAEQLEASSVHWTFLTEPEWERLGEYGLLLRNDKQYHWQNRGYASFEEFLAALNHKKRKNLKRERRDATANDITIERLTGADLKAEHWDAFYRFYLDTGSRKWGSPYLTREFFDIVGQTLPEDVLLVMARRDGRWIAGAINFIGGDTLYGRNWGCLEDHRFLHFEVCYYQAIDFAIERGLAVVEAGAQGQHKVARGYEARLTYSAHHIRHSGLRDAIARYLDEEREYVEQEVEYIGEHHRPFRRDDAG